MVLEKTLESPLDCKEIKLVHPKEISPEYSLERLMLKLKLQYFVHLMQRTDSFENLTHLKILKEVGIPYHLTSLLRNLYAGQEATVRTRYGTTEWFQIGKEYIKAVYCHCAYLTYTQSTS